MTSIFNYFKKLRERRLRERCVKYSAKHRDHVGMDPVGYASDFYTFIMEGDAGLKKKYPPRVKSSAPTS